MTNVILMLIGILIDMEKWAFFTIVTYSFDASVSIFSNKGNYSIDDNVILKSFYWLKIPNYHLILMSLLKLYAL